jgi:hypothetical protein
VGTVNLGSRAPACPPFNVALRERGPTAIQGKRPRSGRGLDWFPNPEITFLTLYTRADLSDGFKELEHQKRKTTVTQVSKRIEKIVSSDDSQGGVDENHSGKNRRLKW